MKKEYTPATIQAVLSQEYGDDITRRLPLHVPFSRDTNCAPSEVLDLKDTQDPERFNAVGSRMTNDEMRRSHRFHLPVLDVDGGAIVQREGRKVVLFASKEGTYSLKSELRDVLGDNGIDLEVATYARLSSAPLSISGVTLKGMMVSAIALRSQDKIFEAVDSSTKDHSHVYIQKEFSDPDHQALLHELGALGIVDRAWVEMADQEGMGVVRTPWTQRDPTHIPSNMLLR